MSEREEYTPTMDAVRSRYARIIKTDGTLALAISRQKEFDRALAAHDRALREQIARDIEARRNEPGQIELADRFGGYHAGQSAGLDLAAQIVRGEGSE